MGTGRAPEGDGRGDRSTRTEPRQPRVRGERAAELHRAGPSDLEHLGDDGLVVARTGRGDTEVWTAACTPSRGAVFRTRLRLRWHARGTWAGHGRNNRGIRAPS